MLILKTFRNKILIKYHYCGLYFKILNEFYISIQWILYYYKNKIFLAKYKNVFYIFILNIILS